MGGTPTAAVTARAETAAAAVAATAGVEVRTLTTGADLAAAAELFTVVWQTPFADHILRAFELSGNYVAGAFEARGQLVGGSVAFASLQVEPEVHSHITAVAPSHRRSGVGLALKLHQRWWALERGFSVISWTYDPLILRNANFNLSRLGARAEEYLEDVYGDMDDPLNGRDESDRLWVSWPLADPEVAEAAAGTPRRLTVPPEAVERLKPGPDGRPLALPLEEPPGHAFTCRVPEDIETLRSTDPALATAWRFALRDVLGGSLEAGYRIAGLSGEGDYVVSPPGAS